VQLRDEALAKPVRDRAAAHSAVRQMLAKGLADPYTRFLDPQVPALLTPSVDEPPRIFSETPAPSAIQDSHTASIAQHSS